MVLSTLREEEFDLFLSHLTVKSDILIVEVLLRRILFFNEAIEINHVENNDLPATFAPDH